MFKRLPLLLLIAGSAHAADVAEILKKADSFRMPGGATQIETLVQTFKDGRPDREKRYTVLARPDGKSLVLFRSPGEAGQKVLMSGDDFWMLMPGSARPIRITPLQKLLGDAATGDIATMTWSGDYAGTVGRDVDIDGVPCVELDLAALRKGQSYQRVVLHVAKADYRPVHADLYAASNRKLKEARYELGQVGFRTIVQRMTLTDAVQTARHTVVTTISSTPRPLADALFNPMTLNRGDVAP
ncbi:outer membrane lipoprotein-sorting protein [Pseudoduganella flava]|uniref:Outer membrane lipoprotein-sorting protein n=1 Tax=Pseudoduganella flava TaxID=871742 RepID=A0A562PFJ9_9BURK|nr:outer membrane lipoprotein-sorting protein [Pseudoduganella flava]QGZ38928.1 outer membrane lipoprotein-sorting protein [Pseudoduganella flava]TWI43010.1 outer membrane lipoprotein-sorting protein [Pseudoduganella flava]